MSALNLSVFQNMIVGIDGRLCSYWKYEKNFTILNIVKRKKSDS